MGGEYYHYHDNVTIKFRLIKIRLTSFNRSYMLKCTVGSQTLPCSESGSDQTPPTSSVYSRRDVLGIRQKINDLIPGKDVYWKVLSLYIHGMCSKEKFDMMIKEQLQSDELRFLHNELLRAILFNAHFSPCPPPNIKLPARINLPVPETKSHPVAAKISVNHCKVYTAAFLGRLLSRKELGVRIEQLLNNKMSKVDPRVPDLLMHLLLSYITSILRKTRTRIHGQGTTTKITVEQIIRISGGNLCPLLIAKYSC